MLLTLDWSQHVYCIEHGSTHLPNVDFLSKTLARTHLSGEMYYSFFIHTLEDEKMPPLVAGRLP